MKRREFIGAAAGSMALASAGTSGCSGQAARLLPGSAGPQDPGLPLKDMRDRYRHYLFEDFLPFHHQHVIDHEHGGFMCSIDRDGTRLSSDKRAWYEGRGTWTYAFLYNNIDPDPRHLETARRSVEFILPHRPDEEHFWPSSYSREGRALQAPGDRDLYGDCFIAAGIAEYARAIEDEAYWTIARDILVKCVRLYDAPDFCPEDRSWLGDKAPPITGMRTLSAWMLFLWVARALLDYRRDPEVEAIVHRSIDAVLHHHHNPAFDLINEVINHDLSHTGESYDQFVPPATVNEALWLILHEARRGGDAALLQEAAQQLKRHLEVGWDDVYGGVYMNCFNVDANEWDSHRKALWAQVETLNGLFLLIEHTDLPWAQDWFARLYGYVMEKWPCDQYGYPLWLDYTDRKVTFEEHWNRADVLHYPRHLMHALLSVERMMGAGRDTSRPR